MGGAKVREQAFVEVQQGTMPLGALPSAALPQPRIAAFGGLADVQGYGMTTSQALTCSVLTLQPLTPDDFDDYRAVRSRNAASLRPFEPESPEGMLDPSDSAASFEASCVLTEAARWHGVGYSFGVFADGRLAGEAELADVVHGATESAAFQTWIDQDGQRNGLASAAFTLLCRFAFEELGLQRVECLVMPSQSAVRAALENVGVHEEGIRRASINISGVWEDQVIYAITAADWADRGEAMVATYAK